MPKPDLRDGRITIIVRRPTTTPTVDGLVRHEVRAQILGQWALHEVVYRPADNPGAKYAITHVPTGMLIEYHDRKAYGYRGLRALHEVFPPREGEGPDAAAERIRAVGKWVVKALAAGEDPRRIPELRARLRFGGAA